MITTSLKTLKQNTIQTREKGLAEVINIKNQQILQNKVDQVSRDANELDTISIQ